MVSDHARMQKSLIEERHTSSVNARIITYCNSKDTQIRASNTYLVLKVFGATLPRFFLFPSKKMRSSLIRNTRHAPITSSTFTPRASPTIAHFASTVPSRSAAPSTRTPRLVGAQIGVYHFHSYSHRQTPSIEEQVPVQLAYDVVEPSNPFPEAAGQSLVICHGLLYAEYPITCSEYLTDLGHSGSKQNWRSLAKAFAAKLGMPVYTLVYHALYVLEDQV